MIFKSELFEVIFCESDRFFSRTWFIPCDPKLDADVAPPCKQLLI